MSKMYYEISDLIDHLHASPEAIDYWIETGILETTQIEGRTVISQAALETFEQPLDTISEKKTAKKKPDRSKN